MAGCNNLRNHSVEQLELSRRHINPIINQKVVRVQKQIRMVDNLSQLHHCIP